MPNNEQPWLSNEEFAKEFGVPLLTVRKWRSEGTGPRGIRFGRHVRYSRQEVDSWVARRQREQT